MPMPHVYQAIAQVTAVMAKEGISKERTAGAGGGGTFRFRGIDDVYNALSTHLAAAGLCILPRVLDRTVTERTNAKGTVVSYVVLTVEFDLVSAVDGSKHVIRTMGEAMDTSDKATNKAMSAAMKYACLLAFQIPTEGDNDTENGHHERRAPAKVAAVATPEPIIDELADRYTTAKTSDDIAAADAAAARLGTAKLLTQAARQRLLALRAEAAKRLSGAA
jgi:hypothetical protein